MKSNKILKLSELEIKKVNNKKSAYFVPGDDKFSIIYWTLSFFTTVFIILLVYYLSIEKIDESPIDYLKSNYFPPDDIENAKNAINDTYLLALVTIGFQLIPDIAGLLYPLIQSKFKSSHQNNETIQLIDNVNFDKEIDVISKKNSKLITTLNTVNYLFNGYVFRPFSYASTILGGRLVLMFLQTIFVLGKESSNNIGNYGSLAIKSCIFIKNWIDFKNGSKNWDDKWSFHKLFNTTYGKALLTQGFTNKNTIKLALRDEQEKKKPTRISSSI